MHRANREDREAIPGLGEEESSLHDCVQTSTSRHMW